MKVYTRHKNKYIVPGIVSLSLVLIIGGIIVRDYYFSSVFHTYTKDTYTEIGAAVTATNAIVYDIDSQKVLLGKNIDTPIPIASITKLFIAILADQYVTKCDTPASLRLMFKTLVNIIYDQKLGTQNSCLAY